MLRHLAWLCLLLIPRVAHAEVPDVVIYGGTSAGVAAAVQVHRWERRRC